MLLIYSSTRVIEEMLTSTTEGELTEDDLEALMGSCPLTRRRRRGGRGHQRMNPVSVDYLYNWIARDRPVDPP